MAHITVGVDVGKASHRAAAYDPAYGARRAVPRGAVA
jgi:ribulose kinase